MAKRLAKGWSVDDALFSRVILVRLQGGERHGFGNHPCVEAITMTDDGIHTIRNRIR